MARVETRIALDMTSSGPLNFAGLLEGRSASFDSKTIRLDDKKTHERDAFFGTFTFNASARTISGTAKTWVHRKDGHLQFEITNASISAKAVLAAAKTSRLSDDRAIIEKTFAKNDLIAGSKYADKLLGFDGDDTLQGGRGVDTIDGGKGNDLVSFADNSKAVELILKGAEISYAHIDGQQSDRISNIEGVAGGSGNDHLAGDSSANLLLGNDGHDLLEGGSGSDTLNGGAGNDTLLGGSGKDSLIGGIGNDVLDGGASNDTLDGGHGNDTLAGGGSNDLLRGGAGSGADFLDGGRGSDSLEGGDGDDSLIGGHGNDTLKGGNDNDTLIGGNGKDLLSGGTGRDVFRFLEITDSLQQSANRDVITSFNKYKTIDLSAIDAITSIAGDNEAFVLDGQGARKSAVEEGHISWYTVNKSGSANDRTYVRVNNDADAAIDMTIELRGIIQLTESNFIL